MDSYGSINSYQTMHDLQHIDRKALPFLIIGACALLAVMIVVFASV